MNRRQSDDTLPEFQVGDRVRLSELGKSRTPRTKSHGTVVRIPRWTGTPGSVQVLFDGNKEPTKMHRSYLEIDL